MKYVECDKPLVRILANELDFASNIFEQITVYGPAILFIESIAIDDCIDEHKISSKNHIFQISSLVIGSVSSKMPKTMGAKDKGVRKPHGAKSDEKKKVTICEWPRAALPITHSLDTTTHG
jgi:hypothetical protein